MRRDEAELELTAADAAPIEKGSSDQGAVEAASKPTQFTLKGAFIALTLASVWLAAMGNEKLRGPGSIASLMALCFASGYVLRFLDGRIKHFAARGFSPASSGLSAAAAGSTGAVLYGAFLVESFSFSMESHLSGNVIILLVGGLTTLLLAIVAWVVVSLLGVMMVVDLFRRRARDLPMVFLVHLIDAALGAALFSIYFAVGAAALRRFDLSYGVHWPVVITGAVVGAAFGSSGVNSHFERLDTARAKSKAEAEV